jgi:hypothetical protein
MASRNENYVVTWTKEDLAIWMTDEQETRSFYNQQGQSELMSFKRGVFSSKRSGKRKLNDTKDTGYTDEMKRKIQQVLKTPKPSFHAEKGWQISGKFFGSAKITQYWKCDHGISFTLKCLLSAFKTVSDLHLNLSNFECGLCAEGIGKVKSEILSDLPVCFSASSSKAKAAKSVSSTVTSSSVKPFTSSLSRAAEVVEVEKGSFMHPQVAQFHASLSNDIQAGINQFFNDLTSANDVANQPRAVGQHLSWLNVFMSNVLHRSFDDFCKHYEVMLPKGFDKSVKEGLNPNFELKNFDWDQEKLESASESTSSSSASQFSFFVSIAETFGNDLKNAKFPKSPRLARRSKSTTSSVDKSSLTISS